jgi:drug/metabolite transporter (DMT)-like permease
VTTPAAIDTRSSAATTGTALTLAAALGFAAVSTLTSIAVAEGTSVPNVLTWRYVLASVVMTVLAGMNGFPKMAKKDVYAWLVIGGGGQALFVGLALSSIKYIPVATLAFLFYTYPAWVTLVQAVRGAEKLTARRALALGLSFAGIVVMVGVPSGVGADGSNSAFWKGVALALSAAMLYGIYIPTARQMQKTYPVPVTGALAKIGAAACLLLWALGDGSFDYALTGRAWSAIAALTIFSTVLPSLFFLMGLIRLGPVRTAIVSTVEPFLTAVIGAVFLGQAISMRAGLGGAMIVGAVLLLQFRRERVA